jgi:hypothetical protein
VVTRIQLQTWLDNYQQAWENRDPQIVATLFTEEATYYITPFNEPLRGRAAIVEYWHGVSRTQENGGFNYRILALNETSGICHWVASFTRKRKHITLDGTMLISLNTDGNCFEFREWWHRSES